MELAIHTGVRLSKHTYDARINVGRSVVDLQLQFGFGMMEHSRALIRSWGQGTAILSQRDLSERQLVSLSEEINSVDGGAVMVDPQFYLPHSDHERLRSHKFWPRSYDTSSFWGGESLVTLLRELAALNEEIGSAASILPGLLAREVNEDWIATQEATLNASADLFGGSPRLLTVALSAEAVRRVEQVERLVESAEEWEVDGYYLVLEHPSGQYFVDDPNWVASVLDIVAALKLRGAYVLLGYSNQQMLIAGCAKVDAIASGTWMNVRSFPPDKFRVQLEDEIKQRAIWYYCPQSLSEYKIPFLDIAFRQKILAEMAPRRPFSSTYASHLFSGGQPSSIGLSEQDGFRHYLECLQQQAKSIVKDSFDETVSNYEEMLTQAERLLRRFGENGVRGQHRDFAELLDVNRSALQVLRSTHGPMLRRRWSQL
jgi:hypothetical protein